MATKQKNQLNASFSKNKKIKNLLLGTTSILVVFSSEERLGLRLYAWRGEILIGATTTRLVLIGRVAARVILLAVAPCGLKALKALGRRRTRTPGLASRQRCNLLQKFLI